MKSYNKVVILARIKLNSTESKISEAVINNDISYEDVMTIINKGRNYRESKESFKRNKTINNSLKSQI